MEYFFNVTSAVMKGLAASIKIHAFSTYKANKGTIYENLKLPSTSRRCISLSNQCVKSKKCRYFAFRKLIRKSRKKVASTLLLPSAKTSASDDQSKCTELAVVDCGVCGDAASSLNVKRDLGKLLVLPTSKHSNLSLENGAMTKKVSDKVQWDFRKQFINDQSNVNKPSVGDNHLQLKALKSKITPCNHAVNSKLLANNSDLRNDVENEKIEANSYSAVGKVLSISRKFVLDKVSLLEDSSKSVNSATRSVNQWTVSIMAKIERQVSFPGEELNNSKSSENDGSSNATLVKQHRITNRKTTATLSIEKADDDLVYAEKFQSYKARTEERNLCSHNDWESSSVDTFLTPSQSALSLSHETKRDKYSTKAISETSSCVNATKNQSKNSSLKPDLKPFKCNTPFSSNELSRISKMSFYCGDILLYVIKIIYAKLFDVEAITIKEENKIVCSKQFAIEKMLSRKRTSISSNFVETLWELQPKLKHTAHSLQPIKQPIEYTYLGSSNRKSKKILTSVETPV